MGLRAMKRIGQSPASDDARWITGDIVAADGGPRL
jgi:hypothetical protein